MTSRFYFDLTNGSDTLRDDEGIVVSSPDEAIKEAQFALDELRGNEEAPAPEAGWQLIIRGEDGATLETLSLG